MKTNKTKAHTRYRDENDNIIPGVTTILNILAKPALIKWANNLGLQGIDSTRYVDDKADIGTLAHDTIHCYLCTDKKEVDTSEYSSKQIKQAENCITSFYNWEKEHNIEPILLEKQLTSKYGFGGTIDIYGKINDKLVLIDLKTGKSIYSSMTYQLAAYSHLLIENNYPIDYAMILNIPRADNENWEIRRCDNLDREFEIFRNCLSIYNLQKEIKGK